MSARNAEAVRTFVATCRYPFQELGRGVIPRLGLENLWLVWGVWLAVVLLLYPACKWYAALKRRRKDWWLSYL